MLRLAADGVEVVVDERRGARLVGLRMGGHDLLVPDDPDPLRGGCYPMAPWAGRVRRGTFQFAGAVHHLPLRLPPHAIHGTVLDRAWEVTVASATALALRTDLGPDWPFPGWVEHRIAVGPLTGTPTVTLDLAVHAAVGPMPVVVGWHPWFRRHLGVGGPAEVTLAATWFHQRDAEGIPTGVLLPAPAPGAGAGAGTWDDCFVTTGPAEVHWPGVGRVTVTSPCPCTVLYDGEPHAVCVEPQSAPPDALDDDAPAATPGHPVTATMSLSWQSEPHAPQGAT